MDRASFPRDPATALVVVDVQNDFGHPDGSLYVRGGEEVVPVVNELVRRARAGGAPVVYSKDWHPERTPHFRTSGGVWPEHCVRNTWGAELVAGLDVASPALFVHKGTGGEDGYSAFTVRDPTTDERRATGLDALLRRLGVERVVVAGLATDYCVRHTALDALALGFATAVVRDAARAVDLQPGDGDRALEEIAARGGIVASAAATLTAKLAP
jgi:nicotinamidase/pyrazinamidase